MKKHIPLFLTFIIVMIALLSASTIYQNTKKPTICIDAGHGGFDGGGVSNEILEKDITINATLILGNLLEQTGYKVIYTRKKDESLSNEKTKDMKNRLKIINKETNLLYISIHANIYPSPIVHGAQVFYKKNNQNCEQLSKFIQAYLLLEDKTNTRQAKAITDKYITDNALPPGCIVELGFMTNPTDLETLTNPKKLEKRCLMIYLGILKYLENNN